MTQRDSGRLTLQVTAEHWPLRTAFEISGQTIVTQDVIVVTLQQGGHEGRGEAAGVDYLNDDIRSMLRQLDVARGLIEAGLTHASLQTLFAAGGVRNALDCALWELESRQVGCPVWQIAGLPPPRPLLTTYTVGAGEPDAMAAGAQSFAAAVAIKIKLTGAPNDAERVRAVRAARPEVWLGVDANQGFSRAHLQELMPVLVAARVQLIEQPFPVGREPRLRELNSPIAIAADESAQVSGDLANLVTGFNVVNIKLDKCGGLTAGLQMATAARQLGFEVMIGNMIGTSLAMAPAFLIGQSCQIVDLDGPLLLVNDRDAAARYQRGYIDCDDTVWGSGAL